MKIPDLIPILAGAALAPILLLAPGYFWSRLIEPGRLGAAERSAWSLLLSLATVPVLAYNFFLAVPYSAGTVWACALLMSALPAALGLAARGQAQPAARPVLRLGSLWIFPLLMAVLAVGCVVDIEWGERLYRGSPAFDYAKHVLVTDAVTRTGVHPVNPGFHPGHALPLFFYLFWFLLCSMLDGLSVWQLGARAAVEAMTGWGALALFAAVLLLAWRLSRPASRRTVAACFVLLFATGLDLPGALAEAFVEVRHGELFWRPSVQIPYTLENWNGVGRIISLLETAIWVPHHLAAALAGMTGLLLVFSAGGPRWARTLLFGLAAASALGLSIWVALVFAAFWAAWVLLALRRRWMADVRMVLSAAGIAALLAVPLLDRLARARLTASSPLALDVRDFGPWERYAGHLALGRWKEMVDLGWLLPSYGLEFGVFLLGGWYWWRRRQRPPARAEQALVILAGVSLALVSFVRSALQNNDFGWRGVLPAQLALLLATGWALERFWRLRRAPLLPAAALIAGFLTVGMDWVLLRAYEAGHDRTQGGIEGRRNWVGKRLYESVGVQTPSSAIVQHNPRMRLEYDPALYGGRQTVVADEINGTVFDTGGSLFEQVIGEIRSIFDHHVSAEHMAAVARKYNIDVLVVRDTDPGFHSAAWGDQTRFRLLYDSHWARAYWVEGRGR